MHVLIAYFIDLVIGDPKQIPHPVVIIGTAIEKLEEIIRKFTNSSKGLLIGGGILTLCVVGLTYITIALLIEGMGKIHWLLGAIISIWFLSTTIAVKGLHQAAIEIYQFLKAGDIESARLKVGWIVGRDTANLDEPELVRATVETVAENIVDGITSPLFYGFLGGAPLAMAYKATNTLDSMVGYKSEKYFYLGRISARWDDIANYLPARITAIYIMIASFLLRYDTKEAWQVWIRDCRQHPSPNSGHAEATVAGALGVRLGGTNYYNGQESRRPYMGNGYKILDAEDIIRVIKIMYLTSALFVFTGFLATYLLKI